MSDHANDVFQGKVCSHCGVSYQTEHGYPVLCNSCYFEVTEEEKTIYVKATIEELNKKTTNKNKSHEH